MPSDHAKISPSAAHRWLNCTKAPSLEAGFPDTTSEAAREGTLAHSIAEAKLLGEDWSRYKKNPLYHEEMDRYTDVYVEEIDRLKMTYTSEPHVQAELRVDLQAWIPEGFGTSDCVIIGDDTLTVVDLKYGKGVKVDAFENPQMMLYALGAARHYDSIFGFTQVRMVIIQPRLDHIDSFEMSYEDLIKWGTYARERAVLASEGKGETKAGSWCRFCRAKPVCRSLANYAVEDAFSNGCKDPNLIGNDEIGQYIDKGEVVNSWLKAVKEYAQNEILSGRSVKGYKVVEGRSVRAFDDQDAAFKDLINSGIDEAVLYERSPLSLAKVEKLIGKKAFEEMAGSHVIKPPGKPTLVPESDKRPEYSTETSAKEAFT